MGKRLPSNGKSLLGKAVHASTAVYDRSVMEGSGITVDEAAAAAVDTIHKPEEETRLEDDEHADEIEKVAVALHKLYCTDIAPQQEYAAVEVQCEKLEITDLGIALTGTTDRVRKAGDGYGIADLKTGKSAVASDGTVKTNGFAYQLGVYELLAEHASGLNITEPARIIGLQVAKTERGQRAGVSQGVTGARDVLVGDSDSPGVLEMVSRMINAGAFPGNPRSMMCHNRYCPIYDGCKYRR